MQEGFTAVVKQSGPWWIGWIEEIPGVNCQERTREELLETLRVTLREALELNRSEAIEAAGQDYEGLCCKPDVGVSQIRTTTVLSSCFCVGQTVL